MRLYAYTLVLHIHLSQLNHTACVTSGFHKYCLCALYTHLASYVYSWGSLAHLLSAALGTYTVGCPQVSPRRQVSRCFHPVRLISLVLAYTTQVSPLRRHTYTRCNTISVRRSRHIYSSLSTVSNNNGYTLFVHYGPVLAYIYLFPIYSATYNLPAPIRHTLSQTFIPLSLTFQLRLSKTTQRYFTSLFWDVPSKFTSRVPHFGSGVTHLWLWP